MKYFYYTIYLFYKKVIKIEYWGDEPYFYCNIILSLFQVFLLNSAINFYLLFTYDGKYISYSKWLFFTIGMILLAVNSFYFKNKKHKIIKEISSKPKKIKTLIVLGSLVVFISLITLYFHSGNLIRINNGY